jgi:alpha-D-ribose 1-methylphosphonate 5-triphosphate synthase subunit PhnG
MTPEDRYEALADAPGHRIEALADRILATGVEMEVLRGPEVATAPVRLPVPGTASTTAVVGHAALTTCAVLLAGARGDSCRAGRDLRGALAAALCDAEAERRGPLAADVQSIALQAINQRAATLRSRARDVALTRTDRT